MSHYGKHWSIDGVIAGPITRLAHSGRYTVLFEREFASIEQIEAINWAAPTAAHIGQHEGEQGLPEGYGFTVADIRYHHAARAYQAELQVASQYLGDVAGYQDQIAQLEAAAAEQTAALQSLQAASDTLAAEMVRAYAEGVESNG